MPGQSTMAQQAETTVAECSLRSCVWAHFLIGSHTACTAHSDFVGSKVYAFSGVTCHLHFEHNISCHCGKTGLERTPNKSQHTKLTLEMKILLRLLPEFETATFRSRVRLGTSRRWTCVVKLVSYRVTSGRITHQFQTQVSKSQIESWLPVLDAGPSTANTNKSEESTISMSISPHHHSTYSQTGRGDRIKNSKSRILFENASWILFSVSHLYCANNDMTSRTGCTQYLQAEISFFNNYRWPYRPKSVALILGLNTESDDFRSAGTKYWFSVFIQIGCFRHFSVREHYF